MKTKAVRPAVRNKQSRPKDAAFSLLIFDWSRDDSIGQIHFSPSQWANLVEAVNSANKSASPEEGGPDKTLVRFIHLAILKECYRQSRDQNQSPLCELEEAVGQMNGLAALLCRAMELSLNRSATPLSPGVVSDFYKLQQTAANRLLDAFGEVHQYTTGAPALGCATGGEGER